jgi:hypothetical protein
VTEELKQFLEKEFRLQSDIAVLYDRPFERFQAEDHRTPRELFDSLSYALPGSGLFSLFWGIFLRTILSLDVSGGANTP